MNFLGHLYFSNNDTQLMYANLLGDFVKGSDYTRFPEPLQKGIALHRTIDNFIDTHPAVLDLLHHLYGDLPKIAGIAVDLYFDHILAKNWDSFHSTDLRTFTRSFYQSTPEHEEFFPDDFRFMLSKMKELDWLYAYRTHEGLVKASTGLSQRISFKNELDKAPEVFIEKEQDIEKAFDIYMKDAVLFFGNYFKKNQ